MPKFATKAADNMFCQARYEAAKFNERLSSREGAAEELGVDRTRLARIELGSVTPYPEEAEIELEELRKDIEGSEALEEVERRLKSAKETLEKAQIQKGVLTQRVEDVEAMRSEIALLNKGIAVAAEKADCYEALKQAFSQDGVPHQIIRNIIPHITDTANNILGSMTGGTMGVEFVMERTVKGKRDITKLSTFLKDMVGVGILIPDEDLEDYVREVANLPERTLSDDPRNKDEQREAQRRSPEKEGKTSEVEPEENQEIEEAKKRLGR